MYLWPHPVSTNDKDKFVYIIANRNIINKIMENKRVSMSDARELYRGPQYQIKLPHSNFDF